MVDEPQRRWFRNSPEEQAHKDQTREPAKDLYRAHREQEASFDGLFKKVVEQHATEPKSYREILSEMFGKSEQREDFKDRTSATIPGLLPPSAQKIKDHEMER